MRYFNPLSYPYRTPTPTPTLTLNPNFTPTPNQPKVSYAMRVSFPSVRDAAAAARDMLNCGVSVGRCELLDDTMVHIINATNPTMTPWPEKNTLMVELTGRCLLILTILYHPITLSPPHHFYPLVMSIIWLWSNGQVHLSLVCWSNWRS